MNKRIDIQILRAFAVIFVVLFHLEVTGIQSGFLGVDVFFCSKWLFNGHSIQAWRGKKIL